MFVRLFVEYRASLVWLLFGSVCYCLWWPLAVVVALAYAAITYMGMKSFRVPPKGVVLISGCSTGIGNHAACFLATEGYHVLAGVRKEEDCRALKAQCPKVNPVILDVTKEDQVNAVVEVVRAAVRDTGLPLVALVNNAGIAGGTQIADQPMDKMRALFDVNVFGLVALTQALIPELKKTPGSRIINVGSIVGQVTLRGEAIYSASKHAVEAINDSLRRELAASNISVSLLEPGAIQTAIWKKELYDPSDPRYRDWKEKREKKQKLIDSMYRNAATCAHTSNAILHALSSSSPKTRYLVGDDAYKVMAILPMVSDRVLDGFL